MKLLFHSVVTARLQHLQHDPKGSHLWYGPATVGKYAAALELAKRLNCPGGGDDCVICRQIESGNFPDLQVVRPQDKASIGIEQIRHLDGELGLKPYRQNTHRVIIIDQADKLTLEAQNALLKSIEEPPPATTFILLAVDRLSLIPTVRSRCLELCFAPVPVATLASTLQAELSLPSAQAQRLAQLADGLPGRAITLSLDSAALAVWEAREAQVMAIFGMSLFDRLVLVRQLHDAKADLVAFGERVVVHIRHHVRQSQAVDGVQLLEAAEHYLERLRGGVATRTALEGLMLEQ